MMKIAIASGKGGTGKTTIATNLAVYLSMNGNRIIYADCDVEEPNGHLFLNPIWENSYEVTVKVPLIDEKLCTFCGDCVKICQFNALAVLSNKALVFPSLCHSCGGCFHICPEKAISEIDRTIGFVKSGYGNGIKIFEGRLNIGEALSPPVIKKLKTLLPPADYTIIDSPPGTSCPVIESIESADYVILVTEPTPFGLNDLKLAVDMVRSMSLPFGVVVNRHGLGDNRVHTFCNNNGVDILLEIPNDLNIARACSSGKLLINDFPLYADYFGSLMLNITETMRATGA